MPPVSVAGLQDLGLKSHVVDLGRRTEEPTYERMWSREWFKAVTHFLGRLWPLWILAGLVGWWLAWK